MCCTCACITALSLFGKVLASVQLSGCVENPQREPIKYQNNLSGHSLTHLYIPGDTHFTLLQLSRLFPIVPPVANCLQSTLPRILEKDFPPAHTPAITKTHMPTRTLPPLFTRAKCFSMAQQNAGDWSIDACSGSVNGEAWTLPLESTWPRVNANCCIAGPAKTFGRQGNVITHKSLQFIRSDGRGLKYTGCFLYGCFKNHKRRNVIRAGIRKVCLAL